MTKTQKPKKARRPRVAPKMVPRLPATPEEVAKALFTAVKPPDPSKRKRR